MESNVNYSVIDNNSLSVNNDILINKNDNLIGDNDIICVNNIFTNQNEDNLNEDNLNEENLNLNVNEENLKNYDIQKSEYLNNIKQTIENMDKVHHIEILKILTNENINFNENNNGTFINLTDLNDDIILKLQNYIDYFKKQQNQLINLEEQKKQIENCYFN